jgi:hypothetical protein
VALLTKQVSDKPLPPSEKCPEAGIPHGLEEIVLRCLAKKPKDRYLTAHELTDALADFAAGDTSGMMLLPTRADGSGARPMPSPPPTVVELPPSTSDSSIGLPARHRMSRPVLVGAGLISLAGLGVLWTRMHADPAAPSVAIAADRQEPPLDVARRLATNGDLDGADRILSKLREEGDSAPVQEELSNVAERRGNRLSALAHLHRATRLSPRDPAPRAQLAALLLRLGQPLEACRQARAALALPSKDPPKDAEKVIAQARCKETH